MKMKSNIKRLLKSKILVLVMLAAFTLGTVNCGLMMHPERKGQKGDHIDTTSLVLDCLWLFAGVIPGVVALVVDFTTGGVYESGSAINVVPGQKFTFRLRGPAPQDADVAVDIKGSDGYSVSLLYRKVLKDERAAPINFIIPAELAAGKYSLSLTINDTPKEQWSLLVDTVQE